jgi:hypothetical protein|tara:strand:- start:25 stop:228 length:204 start_codon:yes stop_codon:yes gene_type:complete
MIVYKTFMGTSRTCEVLELFDDDPSGREGFYARILNSGEDVWGYDDQITGYVPRAHIPMGNHKGERV